MAWEIFNRYFSWFRNARKDCDQEFQPPWLHYVNYFQKIVVWENPVLSAVFLAVVNIVFWLIVYLEWRFYGLFFFSILIAVVCDLASRYVQMRQVGEAARSSSRGESSSSVTRGTSAAEARQYICKLSDSTKFAYEKFQELHQEQPGTFCLLLCGCCLGVGVVGRSLSGLLLLYLILMAVMIVPALLVRYIPRRLLPHLSTSSQKDSDSDVEEYLPERTRDVIELLNLVGDRPADGDVILDSARSLGSASTEPSLYPDLSEMPSQGPSLEYLEHDLELPSPRQIDINSDDSDLSEHSDIQFKGKHFNGSTSGSEGEDFEFAKGLKFPEHTDTDRGRPQPSQQLPLQVQMLAALGSSLLSGVATAATQPPQQTTYSREDRELSSDSDSFEIISKDDL